MVETYTVEGTMEGDQMERLIMTVEEAARTLGIGRGKAYELAREGLLPCALRLGRRIVVSRHLIQEFLSGGHSVEEK